MGPVGWLMCIRSRSRTLGGAYLNSGASYERKGDLERAIADATKAIRLLTEDLDGALARISGDPAWRDLVTEDLHSLHGQDIAKAYGNRGIAFAHRGIFNAAIDDFTQAIETPGGMRAFVYEIYIQRGIARCAKGQYDAAMADFNEAIPMSPDAAMAHRARGVAYAEQRDVDSAIKDFTKVIMLEADYRRAFGLERDGEATEKVRCKRCRRPAIAGDFCDRCHRASESRETAWMCSECGGFNIDWGYGIIYRDRYYCDDCAKLRGFREEGALAYCNRGASYFDEGVYDQALEDLNRAVELDRGLAVAYYNRALVYKMTGRVSEASADATKATELGLMTPIPQVVH